MAARKLCIGLTGRMASGKGEAVRMLENRGFKYASLSDIVRREAARIHPAPSRGQLQDIGNRLRAEGGAGVLGRMVREAVESSAEARWVIDGIRNPAEVLELRRIGDFYLVSIDCDLPVLLARMKKRGRLTDVAGGKALRLALEREWGSGEPEGGQQVGPTMAMADFTVANNGSLAELQTRLDEILKRIGAGHA